MKSSRVKKILCKMLGPSGVQVDGSRPWDIRVHNPDFYERVLSGGSLALGESYMDGWWDCEALDQFFEKIMENRLDKQSRTNAIALLWVVLKAKVLNAQKRSRAYIIGERHYDIGNDLFSMMLDKDLNYSCAYWKNAETLDAAQEAKLDLICRKIGLKSGMKVLDIGCGWGGFAKYAAEKYGAKLHGVTVSREQVEFGNNCCQCLDVKIELKDYRKVREKFDRIVSIGMFEHVGVSRYPEFFAKCGELLADDGVGLLHTIGRSSGPAATGDWVRKYIFPGGYMPALSEVIPAIEQAGLFITDIEFLRFHYADTLRDWRLRFNANRHKVAKIYDERFCRMWEFYLAASEAAFRFSAHEVFQIQFAKRKDTVPDTRDYMFEWERAHRDQSPPSTGCG